MNTIKWTDKARRQANKIKNRAEQRAVFEAVGGLSAFPEVQGVKKLTNHAVDYRLRVGNWRVFFNFDGGTTIISIEEVKKRNERTY